MQFRRPAERRWLPSQSIRRRPRRSNDSLDEVGDRQTSFAAAGDLGSNPASETGNWSKSVVRFINHPLLWVDILIVGMLVIAGIISNNRVATLAQRPSETFGNGSDRATGNFFAGMAKVAWVQVLHQRCWRSVASCVAFRDWVSHQISPIRYPLACGSCVASAALRWAILHIRSTCDFLAPSSWSGRKRGIAGAVSFDAEKSLSTPLHASPSHCCC